MFDAKITPYIHVLVRANVHEDERSWDGATFNYSYDGCKWEIEDGFSAESIDNLDFYTKVIAFLRDNTEGMVDYASDYIADDVRFGIDTSNFSDPTVLCDLYGKVNGVELDCTAFLHFKVKFIKNKED